jgi:hypothetical protein
MDGLAKMAPPASDQQEESAAKRVRDVADRVFDGREKLKNAVREARWGDVDNVVVAIVSIGTGAHYFVDKQTGRFFRTEQPRSRKIQSDSPRGVIDADRAWLFPLLATVIPGGDAVLARYQAPKPAVVGHAPVPGAPPPQALGLRVEKKTRRIVVEETEQAIMLGPHQIVGMLRAAGQSVPDAVGISLTDEGYVRVSWTSQGEPEIEED